MSTRAGSFKDSDRKTPGLRGPYGSGEGIILVILRCTCGHDLERHLGSEPCDVEGCPCVGFEAGWDEENEEIVPV